MASKKKYDANVAATGVKPSEIATAAQREEEEYKREQEQAAEIQAAVETEKPNTVTVAMNYPTPIDFWVVDGNGDEHHQIIYGNAEHLRGKDQGVLPTGGQFGLTFNVDADLWAMIEKKYNHPNSGLKGLWDNGLIFATTPGYARAAAAERKETRNGEEPLNPEKTNTKAE